MQKITSQTFSFCLEDTLVASSIGISLIRFFMILSVSINFIFYSYNVELLSISLILVFVLLDYFDGYIFRLKLKRIPSNINFDELRLLRRLIDGGVDRLSTLVGTISLTIYDINFLPYFLIILIRDIIIAAVSSKSFLQGRTVTYPGIYAKVAAATVGLTVVSFIISGSSIVTSLSVILMSIFSILAYAEYRNKYLSLN